MPRRNIALASSNFESLAGVDLLPETGTINTIRRLRLWVLGGGSESQTALK
jgi:hypothetical protein